MILLSAEACDVPVLVLPAVFLLICFLFVGAAHGASATCASLAKQCRERNNESLSTVPV